MITNKDKIKAFISDNKIQEAIEEVIAFSEHIDNDLFKDEIILQARRYEELQMYANTGQIDYEEHSKGLSRLSYAVLNLVNDMPDDRQEQGKKKRKKGIKESKLKNIVFVFLLVTKLIVIGYVWTLSPSQAGGYTGSEVVSLVSILIPVFMAYFALMFSDYFGKEGHLIRNLPKKDNRVRSKFRNLTFIVFPLYLVALLYVISMRPLGIISAGDTPEEMTESFKEVQQYITLIEASFGVYIGKIISVLFRRE